MGHVEEMGFGSATRPPRSRKNMNPKCQYRPSLTDRLRYRAECLCHILFGTFYEKVPDYAKGRWLRIPFGCRVLKFRWFLGFPVLMQSSLLGTFRQVAAKFPGVWEDLEVEGLLG